MALMLLLCACHGKDRCPQLEPLRTADPAADAKAAFAHGDHRLLQLGGYMGFAPGAEGSTGPYRMIEETSEPTSKACVDMRDVAKAYARTYNVTITSLELHHP